MQLDENDLQTYYFIDDFSNKDLNILRATKNNKAYICARYEIVLNKMIDYHNEEKEIPIEYLIAILQPDKGFIAPNEYLISKNTIYLFYSSNNFYNPVCDYFIRVNSKKKERFVQRVIHSLYNTHAFLKQNKLYYRFMPSSYYLFFNSDQDEISNKFKESQVLILFAPIPFPPCAGTEGYFDPEVFEIFKKKLTPFDYAYFRHMLDFASFMTMLLSDYENHEYISDNCWNFIKICKNCKDVNFDDLGKTPFMNDCLKSNSCQEIYNGAEASYSILNSSVNKKTHKMLPVIKEKRMMEFNICYSYYKNIDNKQNETDQKTIKEEAFEAADRLFDTLTHDRYPEHPVLFPLYDELFTDYENSLKTKQQNKK